MFFPTVKRELLRIFLTISYLFGLIIDQIDIIGAYLKSFLRDNELSIFIKLSPRIEKFWSIRLRLMYQLFCNIYGLKQSRKLWNQKVVVFFESFEFRVLNANPNLLIHQKDRRKIIMVSVYMNNFLLASKNWKSVD